MTAFNADNFRGKLSRLSESSQSIQTLSGWIQYHKKHAVLRMETWRENLCGNRGFAAKMNWAKDRVVGYVNED